MQVQQVRSTEEGRRGLPAGFIKCDSCGWSIVLCIAGGGRRYYRCVGTVATGHREVVCKQRLIRAEPLEEAVWKAIAHLGLSQEGNDREENDD